MKGLVATIILNAKLVNKSNISSLARIFDLNTKIATTATNPEWKLDQCKFLKLQTLDLSFSLGTETFGNDDLQMFIHQLTFKVLQLENARTLRNLKVCFDLNFFGFMVLSYLI